MDLNYPLHQYASTISGLVSIELELLNRLKLVLNSYRLRFILRENKLDKKKTTPRCDVTHFILGSHIAYNPCNWAISINHYGNNVFNVGLDYLTYVFNGEPEDLTNEELAEASKNLDSIIQTIIHYTATVDNYHNQK
jgi:hypothetical protein